jgi:hypothetical protein
VRRTGIGAGNEGVARIAGPLHWYTHPPLRVIHMAVPEDGLPNDCSSDHREMKVIAGAENAGNNVLYIRRAWGRLVAS